MVENRKTYRKLLRFGCRTGRFEDEPIDKESAKVVEVVVVGSGVAISGVLGAELFDASAEAEKDAKRLTISRILRVIGFLI
jgi:hypothetical protein